MEEIEKFNEWMLKINNNFFSDNEAMTEAYKKINDEEQEECLSQPAVANAHGTAMTEDEKMIKETLDRIKQIESALGIKEQI